MSMTVCTKKALIRDPSVPIGHKAPMYLNCVCGTRVDMGHGATGVHAGTCETCGQEYDPSGWLKGRPDVRLPDIGPRLQPNAPHTFKAPVQASGEDFSLTREDDSPADRETTPRLFEDQS